MFWIKIITGTISAIIAQLLLPSFGFCDPVITPIIG
jgi:hypothetical protein